MLNAKIMTNLSNTNNAWRYTSMGNALALLCLTLLAALLAYIRVSNGDFLFSDTGQLYSMLENIHAGRGPVNQILPTLSAFQFYPDLGAMEPSILCGMDYTSPHYEAEQYNHFRFHLYSILYPASLLLFLFKTPFAAHGLNIFSFLLFLFIAYKICRKNRIPVFASLITIMVISLHPAWMWAIAGQPYVDRLFLPVGLLLFYYTDDREKPIAVVLAVLAIAALIVEKTMLYSGGFLVVYTLLHYKGYADKRDCVARMMVGVATVMISFIVVKYYLDNPYWKGGNMPYSPAAIVQTIKSIVSNERSFNGVNSLLMVNAPLLLIALIFKPRLFLIGFIMMIPNLLGTIGGAEKTGFASHYHSLYFPFVVYAFILGVSGVFQRFSTLFIGVCIFLGYMVPTSAFYLLVGFADNQKISFVNTTSSANYYVKYFYNLSKDLTNYKRITDLIEENIPLNAKVTITEPVLPYLYKYQNVRYYPYDFENADFLIITYEREAGRIHYRGYSGYWGAEHSRTVNDCLEPRIKKAGYNVDSPIILSPTLALLKRN
ncbi:hypothetical protein RP726_02795 [Candidatus Methylospira mobilis]|uniref:hypothetical protein n=1 Tax=Candidatus Methylospira mobilis TaxID=1808979 RepID=UPI0028E78642|nr:hypothetical protein [Candidatus Methylospira mobilis]WNV05349.1 hypothetical protein RP726_02795 [Candidatus Methylospira mobilis]